MPNITTMLLDALATHGISAFYDVDEGLLIAHPATIPQEKVMAGEHIVLTTPGTASPGCHATAWAPEGAPDYQQIATVYEPQSGSALADDVNLCARAVAEWFTTPRLTAGAVLLAALAEWGITTHSDDIGMSYAIPLDPATCTADVRDRAHLSVADRDSSVEHVPAAHTGWSVFVHDGNGYPVGDPMFIGGDGGPVDCGADSAAAAEAIADYLTHPTH
ncbi:hypothetical protein [Streptomyces sp. NEAU-174]|uniref:hypothetical protein n=1 Tax=Streptomyces sp. NEAU-174 TaxID=3458254 RepID=UPI0040441966